jgi:dolichol-phosphate mannosyltransferase
MRDAPNSLRCLVVLPTYQERDNIAATLDRVMRASPVLDALVVDDGSPDGTGDIVMQAMKREPRIALNRRARKSGLGSAYLAGFEHGLRMGYGAVCTMDADGSHDAASLPSMLRAMHAQAADLVIGSRYVRDGAVRDWTWLRKLNSAAANCLYRKLLGIATHDCTSGFRIYSAALLKKMRLSQLRSTGYSMLVELLVQAKACNARIVEEPILFKNRRLGKSKISLHEMLTSLRTLLDLKLLSGRAL